MAAHDVSHELRGYHGRWTTGGVVKRLVDEATAPGRGRGGKSVEQHKAAIDELKPGQARGVNGFKVTHMGDKGYRVTMPGETRTYASSHDAARAAHGRAHVEPGSKAAPKPEFKLPEGAIDHPEGALTQREERIRQETLAKLRGAQNSGSMGGVPAPAPGSHRNPAAGIKRKPAAQSSYKNIAAQHKRISGQIRRAEEVIRNPDSYGASKAEVERQRKRLESLNKQLDNLIRNA